VGLSITIKDTYGQPVLTGASSFLNTDFRTIPRSGVFSCRFNEFPLAPGTFVVHLYCSVQNEKVERIANAGMFEVIAEDVFGTGRILESQHGRVVIKDFSWSVKGESTGI
jgi:hypothetical protein